MSRSFKTVLQLRVSMSQNSEGVTMKRLSIFSLAGLLLPGPAAAATPGPVLPAWMAGCWETKAGSRFTVECWSLPDGATMHGESRSGIGEKADEHEKMEIVHAETDDPAIPWMTLWATPSGGKRTRFDWIPSPHRGLTFVNASHDYPQRVRYWREGKYLMAEIALVDGSKARRWRYSARGR